MELLGQVTPEIGTQPGVVEASTAPDQCTSTGCTYATPFRLPILDCQGQHIILLCSTPSSRDLIVGDLKLHLSWETDEACLAVMAYHFPDAIQRGDLLRDSPDEIAALIRQHDPEQERIIIAAAGPPCPDFSQVNGSASGREGPEGSKFVFYCDFVGRLETMLPQHRFEHLTENVRMQDRSEMNFFSEKLRATPIIIDSSDLGLINRPRLWWTRIDWTQVKTNPIHQRPLKWSKVDKIYRLHLDVDYTETSSIDTDTLQCHPTITNHQTRIPCLTTPAAPTNEGRAAPRHLKGKIHPTGVARPLPVRPMVLRGMCTTDLLRWETPPHPSLRQGATPWVCQGIYPSGRGDRQVTPQDDGQLLAKFLMVSNIGKLPNEPITPAYTQVIQNQASPRP